MSLWRAWLLFSLRFARLRERAYLYRASRCARRADAVKEQLARLDEEGG